jgi:uncharacterized membrane protein
MLQSLTTKLIKYAPFALIGFITILYTILALLRHEHFQTYGYDLGNHDQTVWLYSRFIYPFVTIEYKFALLNHFGPSLALFAPLYWIWDDVRALLIAQTVLIGASAVPVYFLAKKLKLPWYLNTAYLFSYLLFYGYQYAVNFDVHTLVLGAALIPWFILTLEERRYKTAAVLLLVILGMKENFGVLTGSIGLIYFLRKRYKLGFTIMCASGLYLLLVFKLFIPLMQNLTNEQYRFAPSDPTAVKDIVTNLYNDPGKQEVWKLSLLWFALAPLASPLTFIAAFIDTAFYFVLGNNHSETQTILMHYRSSLAPLLAWSGLYGSLNLKRFLKIPYALQAIALIAITIFFQYTYHLPLNALITPHGWEFPQWAKDNNIILAKVPPLARVAAQDNLIPHLSHRKEIHILWPNYSKPFDPKTSPCGQDHCMWLKFHERVQYVVTDTHPGQNAVMLLMDNEKSLKQGLQNMQNAGVIALVTQQGDAAIWKVDRQKHKQLGD